MGVIEQHTSARIEDWVIAGSNGSLILVLQKLGYEIAQGVDSRVFRVGPEVYKVYRGDLPPPKLFEYGRISMLAHKLSYEEGWIIDHWGWKGKKYPLRVCPLKICLDHGFDDCVSRSPFTPGKRLSERRDVMDSVEVKYSLREAGAVIGDKLGVGGIVLVPDNVKVVETDRGVLMVITDLCSHINELSLPR
jgi:reverse gyrase